jgi:hypothetical protein
MSAAAATPARLESLAHHHAAGGYLSLLSVEGRTFVEALRIVTSEPVRSVGAVDCERLGVVEWDWPWISRSPSRSR